MDGDGDGDKAREEKDLFCFAACAWAFSQFIIKIACGFGWMEGVCEISSTSQGALWETRIFFSFFEKRETRDFLSSTAI
jgi:hypothetical protein